MEHQDWKTIYVKSNKHHDSKTQTQQKQSHFNNFEKKLDKNIENGKMRTEKIDKREYAIRKKQSGISG